MARRRSRWLSLATTLVMVASLVPVGVASGAVMSGGGGSGVPAKATTVDTKATSKGVLVRIDGLARDVLSVDIYRSTAAGDEGVKINDEPVTGSSFMDETAEPGKQYYYTVRVTKRADSDALKPAGRAETDEVLAQVKAEVFQADDHKRAARPADELPVKGAAAAGKAGTGESAGAVSGLAVQVGASGVTTLTSNTTWSPANGSYYVRNDVVVPKGVTLTILPGTKVYFDTAVSGNGSTGTPANPTSGVDLIVHGKLIAKGTSTSRVLLTSIRSYTASATADGLPQRSDWGCVYTDSKAASVISYADVQYAAMGVWAYRTSRPYVTYSDFRDNTMSLYFDDPVTDSVTPRPWIVGNGISGTEYGIVMYWSIGAGNKYGKVVAPYIGRNNIRATTPIDIEVYEESAPAVRGDNVVAGEIRNNVIFNEAVSPVYLYAESYDDHDAAIVTEFSGNQLKNNDEAAVDCWAYAYGSGSAWVRPTFSRDKLTGYEEAFYGEADNGGSSVMTNTGGAYVNPTFVDCQLVSTNDAAIDLDASANGKGAASTSFNLIGGSAQSANDYGAYGYSWSEYGVAASSPYINGANVASHYGYQALYLDASTGGTSEARVNPVIENSQIRSGDDDAIEIYVVSDEGDATSRPVITDSRIIAYDDCLYIDADSSEDDTGTGDCDVSPIVTNSTLESSDEDGVDLSAYSYAGGSTTMNPRITDSVILAGDGYGMYLDPNSAGRSTSAGGVIRGSVIRSYYEAMYGDVDRWGSSETYDSVCSPTVIDSVLHSTDDDAVYFGTWNSSPGGSYIRPKFTDVDVFSGDGYGVDMYAWRTNTTGTVDIAPTMLRTDVQSENEAVNAYAYTSGAPAYAKAGGTYTDCSFSSTWDSGVSYEADNSGAGVAVRPRFYNCDVVAREDYAYEINANGYGTTQTVLAAQPLIDGGSSDSADGIYVEASSTDNTGGEKALADATIRNTDVYAAWDYGVYTNAHAGGTGDAVNDSLTYNTKVRSYYGIENDAFTYDWWTYTEGSGDAINKSITSGVSPAARMSVAAYDGDGVYNYTYSMNGGVQDLSQVKNLLISPKYSGIEHYDQANAAGQTALVAPTISDNRVTSNWLLDDSGVEFTTSCNATMTFTPTVTRNNISRTYDDGIYMDIDTPATAVVSPAITSNTIVNTGMNNIEIDAGDVAMVSDASKINVSKNNLSKAAWCNLFIDSAPYGVVEQNKMSYPGWEYSGNDERDTSCIYWSAVDMSSIVRGNMFRGARSAAVYYEGGEAPKTNWNSFGDCAGVVNRPFNYWTDAAATTTPIFDARYNWWGTSSTTALDNTIHHPNFSGSTSELVNYSGALKTCQPTVKSFVITASGSTRTFKVTFDRPMDKAITTLYFGSSSPYKTYGMRGTWNSSGTVFTGKYTGSLPTGVKLYLNGARDLPGTYMSTRAFTL